MHSLSGEADFETEKLMRTKRASSVSVKSLPRRQRRGLRGHTNHMLAAQGTGSLDKYNFIVEEALMLRYGHLYYYQAP